MSCAPSSQVLCSWGSGGVREFGCGVSVQLVAMYGAVAATTEVVYWFITQAKKTLTQMRCTASNRQKAPRGCGAIQPSGRVLLLWLLRNRQRTESDERRRDSMVRLVFCLWLAVSGFALSQRQATSKDSIDIFVRFPLASSAGRSVHTTCPPARQLPRFA